MFTRSTAQTADNKSSMQGALLLTADYETTTLPPGSSRQHHARVAGPRCAMASYFYRSMRLTTRPDQHLRRCCLLCAIGPYDILLLSASSRRKQQLQQCKGRAYPQYVVPIFGPRTTAGHFQYILWYHTMCSMLFAFSVRCTLIF